MINCQYCLTSFDFINNMAFKLAGAIKTPELTKVMILVTNIGSPINIAMFCLVVLMILWLHKKYEHMIQFAVTISVGALVVFLTKVLVQLPRPENGLISADGYSFASGHATISAIFFTLIAYSYKTHIENLTLRKIFVIANILIAIFVGITRVYLGVHYATDVLAGFLIGFIISASSMIIFEKHLREKHHAEYPNL